MDIDYTLDNISNLIAEALRADLEITEDSFLFKIKTSQEEEQVEINLKNEELNSIVEKLKLMEEWNDTVIYKNDCYEVLVREHSNYGPPFLFRRDNLKQEDKINGIEYSLSHASNEYLVFFMLKIAEVTSIRSVIRGVFPHRLRNYLDHIEGEADIFNLLRNSIPRLMTLSLHSEKKRSISEFDRYADSFLFQISYNLDVAIVPQRFIEEVVRSGRIARNRRSAIEEIEAPRRHFESDLIYHYQMGVASDNPSLEYLSYYHVAEHFFESVFNDDLIEEVKEMITLPDFSYRRKTDIKKLIKSVTKRVKIQNETVTFNELEALKLTLKKYVDLHELVDKINDYDPDLILHYKSNDVKFSGGNTVDLSGDDQDQILSSAATRIYRTRNSIVHSKEGERGKYIPFHHDRMLIREVPLIRFISELIIVKTSQLISS